MKTYTVKLNPGIAEVLQLDDSEMCKSLEVTVVKWSKTYIVVEAAQQGFVNLLGDCRSRQGSGWAQPGWYVNAARAAEKRVRRVLAQIEVEKNFPEFAEGN